MHCLPGYVKIILTERNIANKEKRMDYSIAGLLALALMVGNVVDCAKASPPEVDIKMCEASPVIDGKLNDPCWRDAYSCGDFYVFHDNAKRVKDTTIKVTADNKYLYMGFKCRHPKPQELKMTIFKNNGGRVFGDECIKMFVFPGGDKDKYLRFVLNPANIHSFTNHGGRNWRTTPYLPWPSATNITADGWEAEVAISLWYLGGFVKKDGAIKRGNLSKLRMNVFRRKVLVRLDENAVPMGEESVLSTWAPVTRGWVDYPNLARIEGLGKVRPVKPFIASIMKCNMSNLKIQDGRKFYDIVLNLRAWTARKGKLLLEVTDKPESGRKQIFTRKLVFTSNIQEFEYRLPVESIGSRKIIVRLKDLKNGGTIDSFMLENTEMFDAFLDRNYYTTEKNANLIVKAALPAEFLANTMVIVRNDKGKTVAERSKPKQEITIPLVLKHISNGKHELNVAFTTLAGKKLFSRKVVLMKLPPNPGHEWKIDRVNGIILDNGKPFFPYGTWGRMSEGHVKDYIDAGFNVIYLLGLRHDSIPKLPGILKFAEKYGLKLVLRCSIFPDPEKLDTLEKWINNPKVKRKVYQKHGEFINRLKGALLLDRDMLRLTRQQRNDIFDECFQKCRKKMLKAVEATRNSSVLLGYANLDEPFFSSFDMFLVLEKIYELYLRAAPYHPVFLLYPPNIPVRPEATKNTCDVLGIDPYWVPGRAEGGYKASIVTVAKYVSRLEERVERDHLVAWVIPAASWYSNTHKRPFTGKEIICQAYLSLIYGAKAITYYLFPTVDHSEQYDAYVRLGKDIKQLTPILLAAKVPQNIDYRPGGIDFSKGIVPEIHVRLMRNPAGGAVLLAANCRNYPVDTIFSIKTLSGPVKELFSGKPYSLKQNCFSDRIDAMGVKVYKLEKFVISDTPVSITVDMKADKERYCPEVGTQVTGCKGKNILPNPGFEEQSLPNWPDYYRLLADPSPSPRVGKTGCPWGAVSENPKSGKYCLKSKGYRWFFIIAPQHKKPQKYCFSVYMRTDKPGTKVYFGYGSSKKTVKIEGDTWKRYEFTITVPANTSRLSKVYVTPLDRNATVWFDDMAMSIVK